ncbi:MAG TPA: RDD family protein [Acidimicrobiia bacterium]|nr:RDD family protein [Acidimicrobiia bacterium]
MDETRLIECPVCGGSVSASAHACPHCGHPMEGWSAAGVRYASVLQRGIARLIDIVIVYTVSLILIRVLFPELAWSIAFGSEEAANRGAVIVLVVFVAYFTILEARSGRTAGKSIAGIRVRKADGSEMTAGAALVRNLLLAIPILWPLALIVILVDERNQGHHDKGASTVVVSG